MVADGHAELLVTDVRGRELTVRCLTAIERMNLFQAAGERLASNQHWIGLAACAASVRLHFQRLRRILRHNFSSTYAS